MVTNYQRGVSFERRVRDDLVRRGYSVIRSSGSHGPYDLAAMRKGVTLMVQCKRNGRLDADEWNELLSTATHAGAIPILAEPETITATQARGIAYWKLDAPKVLRRKPHRTPFEP
jgi:Holliday junction resolvase